MDDSKGIVITDDNLALYLKYKKEMNGIKKCAKNTKWIWIIVFVLYMLIHSLLMFLSIHTTLINHSGFVAFFSNVRVFVYIIIITVVFSTIMIILDYFKYIHRQTRQLLSTYDDSIVSMFYKLDQIDRVDLSRILALKNGLSIQIIMKDFNVLNVEKT